MLIRGTTMFGHDTQKENDQEDNSGATIAPQDNNGDDAALTLPSPPDDAPADAPSVTPTSHIASSNNTKPAINKGSSAHTPFDSRTKDDLLIIKQNALQQLTPLIDLLDQTPEERFRTTMMMIQSSDNQTLIKTAYEAAQGIKDEKEKARALLDIVNEVNYFTQQSK